MTIRFKTGAMIAVFLLTSLGVQANQSRFNSIKSGMARTSSVTSQSLNTPSGSDFEDAIDEANSKWGSSYDDTDLVDRVNTLESQMTTKASVSYTDSRDASYYNSAKSYANSAASGAESRAKSHADSRASTAENNSKSYANSVSTSKANTAETNAKSHANSVAATAENRAKSHADSLVNSLRSTVLAQQSEISKLWDAIDAIETGGGGSTPGGPRWVTIHDGSPINSINVTKEFTKWRATFKYREGQNSNSPWGESSGETNYGQAIASANGAYCGMASASVSIANTLVKGNNTFNSSASKTESNRTGSNVYYCTAYISSHGATKIEIYTSE